MACDRVRPVTTFLDRNAPANEQATASSIFIEVDDDKGQGWVYTVAAWHVGIANIRVRSLPSM
jgi:hypothetical protein